MKFQTFSINVGTNACDAKCPFCIAKMTGNKIEGKPNINVARYKQACSIALQSGVGTVLLTGQGEPLLYPEQIEYYLSTLNAATMCNGLPAFPLVELQTNGVKLEEQANLKHWAKLGLSLVCISIAHYDAHRSNEIMGITCYHNFWEKIRLLQDHGLSTRLNCTMLRCGLSSIEEINHLISLARAAGVTQLTVREVEKPLNPFEDKIAAYVAENKPHGLARKLYHWCKMEDYPELPQIPGGGRVFDVNGQNFGIGNCVTETTDPNDVRQIIFWPDGRIAHSWQLRGAQIR